MQRRFRLRRSADFEHLRRVGRTHQHRLIVMSVSPNNLQDNRYGFIVSKGLGKAVVRNRTRRLLREATRLLHPHLHPGHDVVIIARRPIVGQPFVVIQRTVNELFRRAGLIKEG